MGYEAMPNDMYLSAFQSSLLPAYSAPNKYNTGNPYQWSGLLNCFTEFTVSVGLISHGHLLL